MGEFDSEANTRKSPKAENGNNISRMKNDR